jgi:hypothetical protein
MHHNNLDAFISISEAAKYSGFSRKTIHRAIVQGRQDPTDPWGLQSFAHGKRTRTTRRWVREWLERQPRSRKS